MDCGSDNGVIERCAALRGDFLQSLLEQVDIGREILIQIRIPAEVDHKSLILRIAGSNQIEHRLIHFVPVFAHRAGVIDHDAHRHRNVFPVKRGGRLRHAVLESRECWSVEIGNQAPLLVYDGRVQDHFPHLRLEHEHGALIISRLRVVRFFRGCRASRWRRRRRSIGCWDRFRDVRCAGKSRDR